MNYFIIFIVLLLLELAYFKVADRFNIIDKPNLRSSHTRITLRGGGVIFLFGLWLYSAFYGFSYPWFLAGATMVSVVSFVDDIREIPNKIRLMVQFAATLMMFYQLGILQADLWYVVLIALVVCVGTVNAYNFMDGINGITGGYSLAVLVPLLFANVELGFMDSNFLIVACISALVFCLFNFRAKAKCFAGDVGSICMAFIVIFALAKLMVATQDVSYIVFLALYGVDTTLTIVHRILLHENIGEAHRKHTYQLMSNELKLPHVLVSSIYMGLQLLISFGLILIPMNHGVYALVVLTLMGLLYIVFRKKYYWMHAEYLNSQK